MKILMIAGTRPEVIKLAPIYLALNGTKLNPEFVLSGQHKELASDLLDWFEISNVRNLGVIFNSSLSDNLSVLLKKFEDKLKAKNYVAVISQGDTTTALGAAIWAFFNRTPFFHVEAGLRCETPYLPFPEEVNRRLISPLADINFTPTAKATANLIREGIDPGKISFVGNTVLESFRFTQKKLESLPINSDFNRYQILVTAHRRESFGEPLLKICKGVESLAKDSGLQVIWPLHPNPSVNIVVRSELEGIRNITLVEPLKYPDMVALLSQVSLIITDSGGLQEEAIAAKKPVLILREETERQEIIEVGLGHLVGSDSKVISELAQRILRNPIDFIPMNLPPIFGNGDSSKLIVQHLIDRTFR